MIPRGFWIVACLTGLIVVAQPACAASSPVPADAWKRLPEHPRLFATGAQWKAVGERIESDAVSRQLFATTRAQADALLKEAPVEIKQRGRGKLAGSLLDTMRTIEGRVLTLALAARLTGDRRYCERAWKELEVLLNLPDWNPEVYLDTAEATLAAAVGYDWLYDMLSPQQREVLANSIISKGLRPSYEAPRQALGWLKGTNNWNQVCHGGLVIGALSVFERDPDLCRRVVERGVDQVRYSAAAYAPDGVYPEGPMYWSYGTTFHVAMISALESTLGERFGLDAFVGFLASADYVAQVTAPSGQVFNYADCSLSRGFEPVLFWFARRLQQPAIVRRELERVEGLAKARPDKLSRFFPLALLWWDPGLQAKAGKTLPLNWKGEGLMPLGIHRSAWDDPRATYVAIKGGKAAHSHAHMDAGGFVLEADGVRWAVDLGMQSYETLYKVGIDSGLWNIRQDSPRWTVFRIGPESHNIIRFNDAAPRVEGRATITSFRAEGDAPHTILDLTPPYRDQVKSASRGVQLRKDRRVVIQDEWQAGDRETAVAWQWLTVARVTVKERALTLSQDKQTLCLRVLEPADAQIEVQDTATLLKPHDLPNPGLQRIVIRTRTAGGTAGRMVIVAEPGSASAVSEPVAVRPLGQW